MVGIIAPQHGFSCRRCSNRLGRSRKKVINYLGEDLGFDAKFALSSGLHPARARSIPARDSRCARANTVYFLEVP
jgi:hypothetical protein